MQLKITFNKFETKNMRPLVFLPLLLALACGDKGLDTGETDTDADTDTAVDGDTYTFESALSGENSVDYGGQVFRHLLVDDMKARFAIQQSRLVDDNWVPDAGDARDEILFYLDFDDSIGGALEHGKADITVSSTYGDIGSGKNLFGKMAGNDEKGQHKVWADDFVGWNEAAVTSPESLVRHWLDMLDQQAVAWGQGNVPLGPDGAPVPAVYVTPEGLDLQQLTDKFVRGAVAFSQGTDDYLDNDTDDHGLNSDHTAVKEGKNYTALEHVWDEGFGYFGASRDYGLRTDADIKAAAAFDTNGDGDIDLYSEYSWGHSVNAAKRDLGANVPTDYTAQAWMGFWNGRALLAETAGTELTTPQMDELVGYRDEAILAWENAIAATVVHYINATLQDMNQFGTDDYRFADHAKHWSELKGFALVLQFNPHSPLSDARFLEFHELVGDAPVLHTADTGDTDRYRDDLVAARTILGEAYGYDAENLGDDDGENGW